MLIFQNEVINNGIEEEIIMLVRRSGRLSNQRDNETIGLTIDGDSEYTQVGSVIVGTKTFINRARILWKTLGGGMRQVGILCAAALVALQENVPKLVTDHKNAKTLTEGLNKIKGLKVDVTSVQTNIVYFDILEGSHITAMKLGKVLAGHGILLMPDSSSRVRIVINHQVLASDVQYTLSCIKQAMTGVADENGGN